MDTQNVDQLGVSSCCISLRCCFIASCSTVTKQDCHKHKQSPIIMTDPTIANSAFTDMLVKDPSLLSIIDDWMVQPPKDKSFFVGVLTLLHDRHGMTPSQEAMNHASPTSQAWLSEVCPAAPPAAPPAPAATLSSSPSSSCCLQSSSFWSCCSSSSFSWSCCSSTRARSSSC